MRYKCPDCNTLLEIAINNCDNRTLYRCEKCKELWSENYLKKLKNKEVLYID